MNELNLNNKVNPDIIIKALKSHKKGKESIQSRQSSDLERGIARGGYSKEQRIKWELVILNREGQIKEIDEQIEIFENMTI